MPTSESEEYPHSIAEEKLDLKRENNRKTSLQDLMEYEVVFQMPPKKKYSIEIDVINISKAKPKIFLPDAI